MRRALILLALLAAAAAPPGPATNALVFDRVWTLVARRFRDRDLHGVDWAAARDTLRPQAIAAADGAALYAVLDRLLAPLGDSHTYALAPERARGNPGASYGFSSVVEDGAWRVLAIDPGGPAARAGVAVGWRLATVDGRAPALDDPPPAAGEIGRHVFIDDAGAQRAIALAAADIAPPPEVAARRLAGDILLLRVDAFDRGVDRWLRHRLAEAPAPAAVILDLRENEGGDATVVARAAGAFFTRPGALLVRSGRDAGAERLRGTGPDAYRGPLVVLVGRRSASAAEALAALVDETRRGTTIGERTAGALTGAAHYALADGGELSLAESDIRTPGGQRIEGVGHTPTIVVPWPLAGRRDGIDPALARALALVGASRASD